MASSFSRYKILLLALFLIVATGAIFVLTISKQQVNFSADVKPIINSKCITCHGGVKAKGGFSLLFREEALAKTESGVYAIVPGDAKSSEMIRRLTLKDPEERMPYQHAPLSKDEISILTRWVDQGAKWGEHWAYQPIGKTPVPDEDDEWIRNDIDKFILARLQ
ncbi:MAG: hypothetical protein H7Y27_10930, partial [Gemmatimonadaceae bacterium]|nr:hypothetical protein [Chitinophagaceae bacterium]